MSENASKLWDKIKKFSIKTVSESDFNMFFKNVEAKEFLDNTLTLTCGTQLIKTGIEKYKKEIEDIAELIIDENIDIAFEVKKTTENLFNESYKIKEYKPQKNTGLNSKYNLQNFVIGNNNKVALEACVGVVNSISERDEPAYNPLLIYGSSGLGKTHLMQAVGNAILERRPDKRVYYVTSEEFANEYFRVLREHRIEEFRDSFRNLDVLLLDDIQFFEKVFGQGSGTLQEEFFHTFNKLQDSGKQVIMISDRYPKDIKNLSERIESRVLQGVLIEMTRPGYETRMAILKNFLNRKNTDIDMSILEYIADSVSSNVRELEGVLTTLIARSTILNEKLTLQQAQDELANRIKSQKAKITAEKIIDTVSSNYDIPITQMKAKNKKQDVVNARQIAMYLLKEILDLNLTTIGGIFGGKDHSTVISSIRKIEGKIEDDDIFKNEINRMKQIITQ